MPKKKKSSKKSRKVVNRFGLSRYVPEDIARVIRQECGFGCIVCGASIVNYEHIDPEWHDATTHDPDAMALLCYGCHGKVNSKFLSKETVKEARKNPLCKQRGFSEDSFDIRGRPDVEFAGVKFVDCEFPLLIRTPHRPAWKLVPIFSVRPAETDGAPLRISAMFFDQHGRLILTIRDNIWKAMAGSWDVKCSRGRIEIREGKGKYSLVISTRAPNGIALDRMDMHFGPMRIQGTTEGLELTGGFHRLIYDGGSIRASIGILVDLTGTGQPVIVNGKNFGVGMFAVAERGRSENRRANK